MPKCLFRYQWVKLPRTHLPVGKGIMGYWAKLASRAAFRKGRAKYCGYTADQHYTFGESDAWLDLWCHTVWQETGNAFSYLAPAIQFRRLWRRFDIGSLGIFHAGAGKRQRCGDFFRRMGMPSLCTVCRAPTAASFSIDCIRWIQRLPCPPAQKSNALLKKCVFAPERRFMNSRKTSCHSSPPHLLSF